MRFRLGVSCAVVAVTIALLPAFPTAAPAPIDWVFVSMAVSGAKAPAPPSSGGFTVIGPGGSGGSGGSLNLSFAGHSTGEGPVLIGDGVAFGDAGHVAIHDLANGGTRVRTTVELGGFDVQITAIDDVSFIVSILAGASRTVDSLSSVFFVTNAVIDRHSVSGTGGTPVVETGSGSRVIPVAGPEATGVAVDASVLAAGTSTVGTTSARGLVGGFVYEECERCTLTWSAPDGRSGTLDQTALPLPGGSAGDPTFFGPAGAWSWSWTGLDLRPEAVAASAAAYAPVGESWRVFSGEKPVVVPAPPSRAPAPQQGPRVRGSKQTRGNLPATGVAPSSWAWLLLAGALVLGRRLSIAR